MRTKGVCVLGLCLGLAHVASGQTDADGLEAMLKGKQLALRSYAADALVRYVWVDGKLSEGPSQMRGLVAFVDDSVKLKGGKLLLSGNRWIWIRDNTELKAMGKSPMRLEVDLGGADPAAVLPQLRTMMFFDDPQSAIDGLPDPFAELVPYPSDGRGRSTCKCTEIYQDGGWTKIESHSSRISNPSLLKIGEPSFTNEARQAKVSGKVYVVFRVTEQGRVDQIWLAKPLGYGLDEAAAKAVQEYQFRPAQLDGKPVGTVLQVEVNFQMF